MTLPILLSSQNGTVTSPPPPTVDLLTEIRDYLVAQGVARLPDVAGSLPPLWRAPREGVPAPGDKPVKGNATQVGDPVVLGLFLSGGIAARPYESQWRTRTVDLRIRARTGKQVTDLEAVVTPLLIDKRDWMMGDQYVIESGQWRSLSPVTIDSQGYDFIVAYWFQTFAP